MNPNRGKYNWTELDKWLALAKKNKVDVLYTFGRVPGWANGDKGQTVPPTDIADWDAFVRAIAQHAKGKIKFWEVWNEPNEPKFWTGDIPTLVTMAQHAKQIIRSVDPDSIVLTPSATWTSTSPAQWFDQYFAAGGGQYADAIAFHGYVGPSPEGIVSDLRQIWSVAAKHSVNKPVWNTEGSWGIDAKLSDPISQANFLARYYILQVSQGVQRFYWYAWDGSDGGKTSASESWGTLWDSKGPRPAAAAYGTVRNWLLTAQLPVMCTANSSGWQCPLNKSSLIVWNPSKQADFRADPKFSRFIDLSGQSHSIAANHVVSIGPSPILLQ